MSWALVQYDVPEPCQVSPPSSSSAPGRCARTWFHQCAQVREAAHLAELPGGLDKVQIGKRVCLAGPGLDAVVSQELVADQVWRLTQHRPDTQIDAGFAEIDRQQLSVTIGVVHDRYIAEPGQIIQLAGLHAGSGDRFVGAQCVE